MHYPHTLGPHLLISPTTTGAVSTSIHHTLQRACGEASNMVSFTKAPEPHLATRKAEQEVLRRNKDTRAAGLPEATGGSKSEGTAWFDDQKSSTATFILQRERGVLQPTLLSLGEDDYKAADPTGPSEDHTDITSTSLECGCANAVTASALTGKSSYSRQRAAKAAEKARTVL